MAQSSKIEWTDVTWNPVAGCTIASAGCSNCYAMRMAARLAAMGSQKYVGLTRKSGGRAVWTGKIALDATSLGAPYKWRKPRKVFVVHGEEAVANGFAADLQTQFGWDAMAPEPGFSVVLE